MVTTIPPPAGRVAAASRDSSRRQGSVWSSRIFVGGTFLAFAGLPLFFSDSFRSQAIGTGLICLGLGIAITVFTLRLAANALTAAQRSKSEALGVLVFGAPHVVAVGLVGLGLIGLGLTMVAVGLGIV